MQGLGSFPLLQSGRPEVVAAWMPRLATGEAVAGFALTEPDAGTRRRGARAGGRRRDGDGYRLTGEKIYISNAPDADVYSVFARTTRGRRRPRAHRVLRSRATRPGLTGEPIDARLARTRSAGSSSTTSVVPAEHVLGEVDRGFRVAMRTLDLFRPSVGAFAVGMAQAAIDAAVDHARERHAFGRPLQGLPGGLAPARRRRHARAGRAAARAPRGHRLRRAASAR